MTYSELIKLTSFEERFKYLSSIKGVRHSDPTFGSFRYLNQSLYASKEWKDLRRDIIIRDHNYDLGIEGLVIFGPPRIHHIEPITVDDVINMAAKIFDPVNLISCSLNTHNAIHYGLEIPQTSLKERTLYDTTPWKEAQ